MVMVLAFFYHFFVQNTLIMRMIYTLLIVSTSAILLLNAGFFTEKISLQVHSNSFVDYMLKYQVFALIIALLTMMVVLALNPDSKEFLSIGQLNKIASKEKWLGINGKSSWALNGLHLLLFISTATAIFMFLAVKHTNSINNFHWGILPFVFLFSLTNAFSEELIFRFGIIGGLFNHFPDLAIIIISALAFGIPHFFGNPGGIIGVFMSAILGYVLCKATIETKGLSIAFIIHFIQDIIIFIALMMMNMKQNTT